VSAGEAAGRDVSEVSPASLPGAAAAAANTGAAEAGFAAHVAPPGDAGNANGAVETAAAVGEEAGGGPGVAPAPVIDDGENGDGAIRNGFGIKIWRDSSKYMGDWVAGKMTGYGEMRWADGRRYVGEWLDNRCNGRGILTYRDGRQYVGEYLNDKMNGKGIYEWSEGARYIGCYRQHRKHGRGIMTWKTGGRYDGEYVDDRMTGYGLMTWADGRRYEGNWLQGRCTGYGTTTFKSGSRYVGEYVADKMQGRGSYSFADGRLYEGEYHANQKHGRGVYKWPNGLLFTGTWYRGAPLAGFLLFPGGECAKTSCTSSSGEACPDTALLRLHEEAQAWIDSRSMRKAKARVGRGGAGGVDPGEEDDERGVAAQAGTDVNRGGEANGKKDGWWGLVSGFGHKGAGEKRPVLQDACEPVLQNSCELASAQVVHVVDGADAVAEGSARGQHRSEEGDGSGAGGGGRSRAGGENRVRGMKWRFINVLSSRRSQRRTRKARADEGMADVARDRFSRGRRPGTADTRGETEESGVRGGELGQVPAGDGGGGDEGCVDAYSYEELDVLSAESEEEQAHTLQDQQGGDSAHSSVFAGAGGGGSAGDATRGTHGLIDDVSHGLIDDVSLHAKESSFESLSGAPNAGGGGGSCVGRGARQGVGGRKKVGKDKTRSSPRGQGAELQEGDLWFYLMGEPTECAGDAGVGVGGGGASGSGVSSVPSMSSVHGMFLNVTDQNGRSRLVRACERGLLDVSMWYIRAMWASVNERDADGCTPLHAACRFGHCRLVKFLLASGAHTDVLDAQQRSVIYFACASGSASTAFLVSRACSERLMVQQVEALFSLLLTASSQHAQTHRMTEPTAMSKAALGLKSKATSEELTGETHEQTACATMGAVPRQSGHDTTHATHATQLPERQTLPATTVLAVLRVWKTWASSEALIAALATRPAILSAVVDMAITTTLGGAARKTAWSLIYAIATHSGNGTGAHQLAVLDALLYDPAVTPRERGATNTDALMYDPAVAPCLERTSLGNASLSRASLSPLSPAACAPTIRTPPAEGEPEVHRNQKYSK
jgi:hypothetical protein